MADKQNKLDRERRGEVLRRRPVHRLRRLPRDGADFFKRNDERGYSFVYRQPTTPDDEAVCYEALEGCPVEAIGDDGEPK